MEDENRNYAFKEDKRVVKGFKKYNLRQEIYDNISQIGYKQPTPIQKKTIPEILNGFNVIVKSRTGSGKSAAFIIPILQKLGKHSDVVGTRVVILSPTRELAKQTLQFFFKLSRGMNLKFALLTGGDKIENQFERLVENPDIIISTPGRLFQHLEEGSVSLKRVDILVIDEADKLFEQGFEDQINSIFKACPQKKQCCLFSATIPESLAKFMKLGMQEYKYVSIDYENKIPESIRLYCIYTRTEEKLLTLVSLLKYSIGEKEMTLVFLPTKHHCEYFSEYLNACGIPNLFIHGKIEQCLRDQNISRFKNKEVQILLVTDLAARGIDIPKLENVINYDFPDNPKLFVHRIGRTGRAEESGRVISLVSSFDLPYLMETKNFISKQIVFVEDEKNIVIGTSNSILNKEIESHNLEKIEKIDEELIKSMQNSLLKKKAFQIKPKPHSVKEAKEFDVSKCTLSSLFSNKDGENLSRTLLGSQLKDYKPKKTIFEHIGGDFNIDFIHKNKKGKNRGKILKEEEDDEKDQFFYNKDKKIEIIEKIEPAETQLLGKKRKRSQIKDFKTLNSYVTDVKNKEESNKLWGSEQPIDLNELTLNICPDDAIKKNSKYAWNEKKNKFVTGQTDSKGNLVIKKNESNVKVKDRDKKPEYFKKWKSQNRDKVQRFGELEKKDLKGDYSKYRNIKGVKNEIKSASEIVKIRKESTKKKYKFAGQVKNSKMKQIGDKVHLNRRSMALVRKVSNKKTGKGGKNSKGGGGGRKRKFN